MKNADTSWKSQLTILMVQYQEGMIIDPRFCITQKDLASLFLASLNHNKSKTVKIRLAVFCCAATSIAKTKTMEDWSSTPFIQTSFVYWVKPDILRSYQQMKRLRYKVGEKLDLKSMIQKSLNTEILQLNLKYALFENIICTEKLKN